MAIWHIGFACWIPKAIHTSSEYVIFTAFPQQNLLHERVSELHKTFIGCFVITEVESVYCAVRTEFFYKTEYP